MFGFCKFCQTPKPVTDFYRSDRHKCKVCVRAAVRSNRAAKAEYYRAYDRARTDQPDRVAARRAYKESPERAAARSARQRAKFPEKRAARIAVGNAIRDGKLMPQPCERCGSTTDIDGHHEDYRKPLDVMWLCPKCHGHRHREINDERRRTI